MDSNGGVPDYMRSLQSMMSLPAADAAAATTASSSNTVTLSTVSSGVKKFKFMLVSTHCHQYTGYSKVSWGILRQLAKVSWLDVVHYGFQKFPQQQFATGYRPYPSSIKVIDAAVDEKPFEQGFGFKQLPDVIRKGEA
jgi:hypothetical protein